MSSPGGDGRINITQLNLQQLSGLKQQLDSVSWLSLPLQTSNFV
jgi:hypothetical protein